MLLAERVGFEPTVRENRTLDFESSSFDHSDTSPCFNKQRLRISIYRSMSPWVALRVAKLLISASKPRLIQYDDGLRLHALERARYVFSSTEKYTDCIPSLRQHEQNDSSVVLMAPMVYDQTQIVRNRAKASRLTANSSNTQCLISRKRTFS